MKTYINKQFDIILASARWEQAENKAAQFKHLKKLRKALFTVAQASCDAERGFKIEMEQVRIALSVINDETQRAYDDRSELSI